jgi:hypothetical protein
MLQTLSDYQGEIKRPTSEETDSLPEFLRVGKLLYTIRESFGTKELDNAIQDTGLKRKGRYWLAIYEFHLLHNLDRELLAEVGWTKIKLLLENGQLEGKKSEITRALKNALDYTVHELDDLVRRDAPTIPFRADLTRNDMPILRAALEAFGLKYGPRGMLNAPLALMNMARYAMKQLTADNPARA